MKKWGNSLGVVLPRELVSEHGLSAGDVIFIDVAKKQEILKELYGAVEFKMPTPKLLEDVRGVLR